MQEQATPRRTIFFVSDGTGITAETLGATLLTQFDEESFRQSTLPFINSVDKARTALEYIERAGSENGQRPIVFSTTVNNEVRDVLRNGKVLFLDLFDLVLPMLEAELQVKSVYREGRAHGIADEDLYQTRIDAMNYALTHDDGIGLSGYDKADVILVAPSRCGKTPVCVYLAMQHGVFAANYPLLEEELEQRTLPAALAPHRQRLYGLLIDPWRLHDIRTERRRGSRYASMQQVSYELRQAASLYKRHKLPHANTTHKSIEEIATLVMQDKELRRYSF